MGVPKFIPSSLFARLAQLPWKILLVIALVSISLHLAFFPETRQSIVRWGQSVDARFDDAEPGAAAVPKEHFFPAPQENPQVIPIVHPAPKIPVMPQAPVPSSKAAVVATPTPPDAKPTPEATPEDLHDTTPALKPEEKHDPTTPAVAHGEKPETDTTLATPKTPDAKTPDVKPAPAPAPPPHVAEEIPDPDFEPGEYIALCMAVKNQGNDLGEFFTHHYHHIGIQRFYIMDDGSEPPLAAFNYAGVPRDALTFVYHDAANHTKHNEQGINYRRCIRDYGAKHTWMGFIDADEFIEMTGKDSLTAMLREFERDTTIGQIVMNWRMHTSGGLLRRPESARKGFTKCISDATTDGRLSDNQHVKPFVRTRTAAHPKGAHMFYLKEGYKTVGEHGDVVDTLAWRNPISRDRIALHHYAVKSREEYEEKMHRGNGEDVPKGELFWVMVEDVAPHVDCPEMAQYDP